MTSTITFPLAVIGGMLSFLSPCVLPLVPPYLSFLAGTTFEELSAGENRRVVRRAFFAALLFVAGFTTVFVILGAGASALSQTVRQYQHILTIIAGIAIIVMGLHLLGVFRIALLYRQARFDVRRPMGLWGAYVMGLAFAFGWTPCIGPILVPIIALAGNEESVGRGAALLAVYSAGLGIPFVIAALLMGSFASFFKRMRSHFDLVEKIMGALLIITGLAFMFGSIASFSSWMQDSTDFFKVLKGIEETILGWFGGN